MSEQDELGELVEEYLTGELELDVAIARAGGVCPTLPGASAVREVLARIGQPLPSTWFEHLGVSKILRAAAGSDADPSLVADIDFTASQALMAGGRFDEARALLPSIEKAIARRGDRRALAALKGLQGSLAFQADKVSEALAAWHAAEREFMALDDERNLAATRAGLGKVYARLGRWDEARANLEPAIEAFAARGERVDEFHTLLDLAGTHAEHTTQQIRTLKRAAALASYACVDPRSHAEALSKLYKVAVSSGAWADAVQAAEEGVRVSRKLGRPDIECIFLGNLGGALAGLDRYEEAIVRLEEARSLAGRIGDADGVRIAERNIAIARERLAQMPEAERRESGPRPAVGSRSSSDAGDATQLEAVLAAARARLEGEGTSDPLQHFPPADAVDNPDRLAGLLDERLEQLEKSDPRLAFMVLQLFTAWVGDRLSAENQARLFSDLASYCMRASNLADAASLFDRAAQVAHAAELTPHFVAAATNLGTVLRQSGRPLEAIAAYEAARDATADEDQRSAVLVNLATAYSDLGLHQQAMLASHEAVTLLRRKEEPSLQLIIALVNAAGSAYALGNLAVAEEQILEALDLSRRLDVPSQEGVALGHLGLIRFAQGNLGAANRLLERAAEIAETNKDLWNAQHWRRDLANALAWIGATEGAHAAFQAACTLSQRVQDVRSEALARLGLGLTVDSRAKAKPFLEEAWRLAVGSGNPLVAAQIAEGAARALAGAAVVPEFWDEAILRSVLEAKTPRIIDPAALTEARHWLERGKELAGMVAEAGALGLDATEAQILALEGQTDRAIELLKEPPARGEALYDAARQVLLGRLYILNGEPAPALTHLELAMDAMSEGRANLRSPGQRLAMGNMFSHLTPLAIECALLLGDTERAFAVLERLKTSELKRRRSAIDERAKPASLAGMVNSLNGTSTAVVFLHVGLRRGNAFVALPTGSDSIPVELDVASIANLWTTIGEAYSAARDPAAAFDTAREANWRAALGNLLADLARRLEPLLGRLEQEPHFERLVLVPQGLLHSFPLHAIALSDGRTLIDRFEVVYALNAAGALAEAPKAEEGEARYGVADSLDDLPCARHELAAARPAISVVGREVSSARLLEAINAADWLHVACHARQVLADDDGTGIYIAPGEGSDLLSLSEIMRKAAVRAGAVIVLSCCETSSSTPSLADEYSSIGGAFLGAGARAVVASLWRADDVATLLLMRRFYQRIEEGFSLPASLAHSQAWLRSLTEAEAEAALQAALPDPDARGRFGQRLSARRSDVRPFEDPASWASFQLLQA